MAKHAKKCIELLTSKLHIFLQMTENAKTYRIGNFTICKCNKKITNVNFKMLGLRTDLAYM